MMVRLTLPLACWHMASVTVKDACAVVAVEGLSTFPAASVAVK